MKHIDKVFRDKLYNQKATVPDGMWDKIAPALEEKSGRSVLWFWFAGILALLISGIAYFMMINNQEVTGSSSPLAAEQPIQNSQIEKQIDKSVKPIQQGNIEETTEKEPKISEVLNSTSAKKPITINKEPAKTKSTPAKVVTSTDQQVIENIKSQPIIDDVASNNTDINNESINTDNLYGKPANLVITKSYLSDNGALIEKSDLSNNKEKNQPSYNVFINSEGLNAGALLRIVEPLEELPLPAFTNKLKKKITL